MKSVINEIKADIEFVKEAIVDFSIQRKEDVVNFIISVKNSPQLNRHKEPVKYVELSFVNSDGKDITEQTITAHNEKSMEIWDKRYKERGMTKAQVNRTRKEWNKHFEKMAAYDAV